MNPNWRFSKALLSSVCSILFEDFYICLPWFSSFCCQGYAVILRVFERSLPFLLFGNLSIISIISVFAHLNHIVEPSSARFFFFWKEMSFFLIYSFWYQEVGIYSKLSNLTNRPSSFCDNGNVSLYNFDFIWICSVLLNLSEILFCFVFTFLRR